MKKVLVVLGMLAVVFAFGISLLYQKAPDLLKKAIEKAIDKPVAIRSIRYAFPGTFELEGFEIRETAPFENEISFSVDKIRCGVSLISFSKGALVIDKIEVENAGMVIRKYRGKLIHSLSRAAGGVSSGAKEGAAGVPKDRKRILPLEIREFLLRDSRFQFVDYDIAREGFVTQLDRIEAEVRNIALPPASQAAAYSVKARLLQGRDERPSEITASGSTDFVSLDTDANLSLKALSLPYFRPYTAQIMQASIESGYLDARANLKIERKDLAANVDLEVTSLLFQTYEGDNQLFGLKAEEILSFLRDRAGRLKFQIVVRWNLADKSVRARDVIRKSIERSLKSTILGNVENILHHTLQKIGEQGADQTKEDVKGALKKVKELLSF